MGQISETITLNLQTLKTCRTQIGMTLEQVAQKINSITAIESGKKRPTYKQLDTLATLYQVPRWVFISDELPEEYQYTQKPLFRKFKNAAELEDFKVRQIIVKVEQYRDLFIELYEDLQSSSRCFDVPEVDATQKMEATVCLIKNWLGIDSNQMLDLQSLKEILQQKNIFIFFTSKYNDWFYVDQVFRGLTIGHAVMPIIIINNSDSKKAQSFTLLHELGHLLRGDTNIDGEGTKDSDIERWCDQFAGEFLMPAQSPYWDTDINDYSVVKNIANHFKVSPYACLVRLRQLGRITQGQYDAFDANRQKEHLEQQKNLKESSSGPRRVREKEIIEQFGKEFVSTVLSTWQHQEMTLYKAIKLLGLKRPQQLQILEKNFYEQ